MSKRVCLRVRLMSPIIAPADVGEPWQESSLCYIQTMKIVDAPIALRELAVMAETGFGDLVKAVVDVELRVMAVDGELHSDEEALLLERGSKQRDLWGINLYPDLTGVDRIEFDSMSE